MTSADVAIRPEGPRDGPGVRRLHRAAFGRWGEARLVDALRDAPAYVPELSLVAVDGGRVVGHVLFTEVAVDGAASGARGVAKGWRQAPPGGPAAPCSVRRP